MFFKKPNLTTLSETAHMNLKNKALALLMTIAAVIPCSIKAHSTCDQVQKIYVNPSQISIKDECILVQLPEGLFGTMILKKDTEGYYVCPDDLLLAKVEAWHCYKCNYVATSSAALNRHMRIMH